MNVVRRHQVNKLWRRFHCQNHEDYALCPSCKLQGMHKNHIKCFKQVSFDTYKHGMTEVLILAYKYILGRVSEGYNLTYAML